ncbi:MAG: hypothetical protein OXU20_06185 [Myxococcales bacterium]|nr:hypothetical protein [Myxococcales bacterium]
MSKWIQVRVDEGLFPSERTVHFDTVEGEISVFVSSNQLEAGKLRVVVLDEDAEHALVQVQSHGGGTVAKVSRSNVLA